MAEKIDIADLKQTSFSDKNAKLFTEALADPESKLGLGSTAAYSAAVAAALMLRAVRCCAPDDPALKKAEADIDKLRTYFVHLIDEENKAKLPLEKRVGKADVPENELEAAYRTACIIDDEILYSTITLIEVFAAVSDKLCSCMAAQCSAALFYAKTAMESVRLQLAVYASKMKDEVTAHTTRREPEIAIAGVEEKISSLIKSFEAKI